jgi:hypothetical protein
MKRFCFPVMIALSLVTVRAAVAQETADLADSVVDARPAASQRFKNFLVDSAGPVVLGETIGWAAAAQVTETPPEWGPGASGFGKRYASLVGQGVIQESVTFALSEALAVDSRFHKSARHGFFPRAGEAILESVTSRRIDGRRVVSAPLLAGYAAGGVGMMTWYPDSYTYRDGLRYGALALASRAAVDLVREFIIRR